jgi:hypothetical protein
MSNLPGFTAGASLYGTAVGTRSTCSKESGSGPSDLYHSSVLCARNQETYTGLLRLIRLQLELGTALLMLV